MAMKRGQKLGISDDSEYLSDDSDFYGGFLQYLTLLS
jgi:hypothetical protein